MKIKDSAANWNELEKDQVEFVSVNEKFDTATPMGRAMIYIIMVFAQLEFEEKKLVAQAFIEKIKVYDDSIEIIWKI